MFFNHSYLYSFLSYFPAFTFLQLNDKCDLISSLISKLNINCFGRLFSSLSTRFSAYLGINFLPTWRSISFNFVHQFSTISMRFSANYHLYFLPFWMLILAYFDVIVSQLRSLYPAIMNIGERAKRVRRRVE
jgi:hypothetical protein